MVGKSKMGISGKNFIVFIQNISSVFLNLHSNVQKYYILRKHINKYRNKAIKGSKIKTIVTLLTERSIKIISHLLFPSIEMF